MAGEQQLSISVEQLNDVCYVELHEEVDLASAPQLRDALGHATGTLVINCKNLTYIDSSGLAVLIGLKTRNLRISLRNISSFFRRVLEITDLTPLFDLEDQALDDHITCERLRLSLSRSTSSLNTPKDKINSQMSSVLKAPSEPMSDLAREMPG